MKASTEEFLYLLLWTAETLMRPTWRNIEGSFEAWAYRNGLGRRLQELERLKLIESQTRPGGDQRVYRLTELGRIAALAGADPAARWARPWDGRWRMVIFDLPENENRHRVRLRRALRRLGFGYLQQSVWLSPDPLDTIRAQLQLERTHVESLTLFEGSPAGGESDQDLVAGAWDFTRIESLYAQWHRVKASAPKLTAGRPANAQIVRDWAARERSAWSKIVAHDPFLPAQLLPANYPGRRAWADRTQLLNALAQSLAS